MEIEAFGELHPTKQQYDCSVKDLGDLVRLTKGSPFTNWTQEYETAVSVDDFTSWFPNDDRVFLYGDDDHQKGLTYAQLRESMIQTCPSYNQAMTVAVLLPLELRAETAVALVALLAQPLVTVAPLDYKMPTHKIKEAFDQLECNGIVTTRELEGKLKEEGILDNMKDIRVVESSQSDVPGVFEWNLLSQSTPSRDAIQSASSLPKDYPRMLLRTSGTTANPKVVALPASQLVHAAVGLAHGLKLSTQDVCICGMPLFHIGGIAGALLCVLVSGSSVLMIQGTFDPFRFLELLNPDSGNQAPTWYYAAPTMHKSLLITAQAQGLSTVPNRLRLVRSAAAHLPHQVALDLAKLFGQAGIYPTYGMSECMPIAIPHEGIVSHRQPKLVDTVGLPAACSISIVDDECGEPLPYGEIGEIAVSGPGAMDAYLGIPKERSHTPHGWLRTGDVGFLDKQGHLFIKGRSKEMIKRGGEQVWPTEIDLVVEKNVPEVALALTFAVPNELWGEEVAIAVVLDDHAKQNKASIEKLIIGVCKDKLDHFAVPQQILFIDSKDELPKGATGKYLRRKIAETFEVQPVDTGILRAFNADSSSHSAYPQERASPSKALNGVRCIAAYFVAQTHIGHFESKSMIKLQSFTLNMPIFFFLLAFQMACDVPPDILKRWGSFVGSKIGSTHAMFVIAQISTAPAQFHWKAKNGETLLTKIRESVLTTLDGDLFELRPGGNMFGPIWFLTVAYQFIVLFPLLNTWIQGQSTKRLFRLLILSMTASILVPTIIFHPKNPYEIVEDMDELHYTIWTWFPYLVATTVAGNLFRRFGPVQNESRATPIFQRAKVWGSVADALSILFLLMAVYAGWFSNDSLYVNEATFEKIRPDVEDYTDIPKYYDYGELVLWAENVTMEEFDVIRADQISWVSVGRWESQFIANMWVYRWAGPLVALWLYGLAFGHGLTATLMSTKPMQFLGQLSYTVYFLHITVAKYYWFVTRGLEPHDWWLTVGEYPFPYSYLELWVVLLITGFAGYYLDRYAMPLVAPYTIGGWVFVFRAFERLLNPSLTKESIGENSVLDQVKNIVLGISGIEVSMSTRLDSMGLDSLGAGAFLGLLRQRVSAAKSLSVTQVSSEFETVEDLVSFLSQEDVGQESKLKKE